MKKAESAFYTEVENRFGLIPNFFRTGSSAPGLIEELWGFAKSGYLDSPFPSLFKERLFVHLSRFCEVRYCIIRHVGFLVGRGNPAGDATATPNTLEQVLDLLRRPGTLDEHLMDAALTRLEEAAIIGTPLQGTQAEEDVFAAATVLFLTPSKSERAQDALCKALGVGAVEVLIAFLAFVRTAHFWTVTHSSLPLEDDMNALLRDHDSLALLLLNDENATRGELGARLYDELLSLRREKDDREALRQALAEKEVAQKHQQMLINELNHRVKNTLAIVQSVASHTLRGADVSPEVREALTSRLIALAQAHDLLTLEHGEGAKLSDVLKQATQPYPTGEAGGRIQLAGPEVKLTPKQALSLAMATHELTTNAAKYGALSNDAGNIVVRWEIVDVQTEKRLSLEWRESGGPEVAPPQKKGFGSRVIQRGLAGELGGVVDLRFEPTGLICAVTAPVVDAEVR